MEASYFTREPYNWALVSYKTTQVSDQTLVNVLSRYMTLKTVVVVTLESRSGSIRRLAVF